jgi:TPR repeat protein
MMKWYRLAANQGLAAAQKSLGVEYLSGRKGWFAGNEAEALKWLHLAADQGEEEAQRHLSLLAEDNQTRTYSAVPMQLPYPAVPMRLQGGTFVVPVLINNAITLNFVLDSGAADVSIPVDGVPFVVDRPRFKATEKALSYLD